MGNKNVFTPNFQTASIEEATKFVSETTPKNIEDQIKHMTEEQISASIVKMNEAHDADWKEKTRAAILGLDKRSKLEAAGKTLSQAQTIELLDTTLHIKNEHHWKLSPLLVGMPHEIFSSLLNHATELQLRVLQQEGVTEPVQHQLTTLSREMHAKLSDIVQEIDQFHEQIERFDSETLSREDVLEVMHRIDVYGEFFQRLFDKSNKALAIAWNTKRLDLIEALNKVKDSCQKYSLYGVGSRRISSSPASGLYASLEDKLFKVYGNINDPTDLEAISDEEPALEALVKFSVWYLRDYWEMGLLPTIKKRDDLDLDLGSYSEQERTEYRETLFAQVKENLERIRLSTVKDLKEACIFSKKSLQEYIQQHIPK